MNVYLTFDVEVWCNNWAELDQRFPAAYERYVYGRSPSGDYALPATLQILNRHGLRGVFFVEPMFAARFGAEFLERIVHMLREAGQDVQLHLHPEWTDEIQPPLLADISRKRQHLAYYSVDEQTQLIAYAKHALLSAGATNVNAFRAGSFAANRATYVALQRNAIHIDSSLNELDSNSGQGIDALAQPTGHRMIGDVHAYPVTVFQDGWGRLRPAQVGACSFAELNDAMDSAHANGCGHFVIVSHNFEMLRPDRSIPDWVVVRRFERLCAYLGANTARFDVGLFSAAPQETQPTQRAHSTKWSTTVRWAEQIQRRLPTANLGARPIHG